MLNVCGIAARESHRRSGEVCPPAASPVPITRGRTIWTVGCWLRGGADLSIAIGRTSSPVAVRVVDGLIFATFADSRSTSPPAQEALRTGARARLGEGKSRPSRDAVRSRRTGSSRSRAHGMLPLQAGPCGVLEASRLCAPGKRRGAGAGRPPAGRRARHFHRGHRPVRVRGLGPGSESVSVFRSACTRASPARHATPPDCALMGDFTGYDGSSPTSTSDRSAVFSPTRSRCHLPLRPESRAGADEGGLARPRGAVEGRSTMSNVSLALEPGQDVEDGDLVELIEAA